MAKDDSCIFMLDGSSIIVPGPIRELVGISLVRYSRPYTHSFLYLHSTTMTFMSESPVLSGRV